MGMTKTASGLMARLSTSRAKCRFLLISLVILVSCHQFFEGTHGRILLTVVMK